VQTAGQAAVEAIQADWSSALRSRIKHADFFAAYARIEEEKEKREGEAFAPWTGVNNCTTSAVSLQPPRLPGLLRPLPNRLRPLWGHSPERERLLRCRFQRLHSAFQPTNKRDHVLDYLEKYIVGVSLCFKVRPSIGLPAIGSRETELKWGAWDYFYP
jgi:hypothetical protein